jgi:uncharacterized protein (TIGR02271 family)
MLFIWSALGNDMSDISEAASTQNTTAYFDTREAADTAVSDLVSAGIPRAQITLAGDGAAEAAPSDRSFWEELKDMFLPAEDRHAYAEGLRRGGIVVSVRSEAAVYARVLEILDRDGAVDLDKQQASWRDEGWTGYQGGEAAADASMAAATSPTLSRAPSSGTVGKPNVAATATLADEVIPVYEEELRVGKRDVSHGRVRIRSYVVETPVNEQVQLLSESVQVERRPLDRIVGSGEALFQDRVIEAEERAEEAVVSKDTRVKEEVTLRKTSENVTQDVRDTVRHTEVEVQDDRSAGSSATSPRTGTTGVGSRIGEHMDVIASDGVKIGTVDHLDGPDRIKLTKSASPDGQHHYVPLTWVDHVDAHVHLTKASVEAQAGW